MTELKVACEQMKTGALGFDAAAGTLDHAARVADGMPAGKEEFGHLPTERGMLRVYLGVVDQMVRLLRDGQTLFQTSADVLASTANGYLAAEGENAIGITGAGGR